jgi:hypothetical protein
MSNPTKAKILDTLSKDIAFFEELRRCAEALLESKTIFDRGLPDKASLISSNIKHPAFEASRSLLSNYLEQEAQVELGLAENKKLISTLQRVVHDLKELKNVLKSDKEGSVNLQLYRTNVKPLYKLVKTEFQEMLVSRLGSQATRMNALTSAMSKLTKPVF